jgi:two-component system sensor histidine kinase VicK
VSGYEEKTETIYGIENTIPLSLQCFARVKERHDSCGDNTLPSVIVTTEPIKKAYRLLLRKGIKSRFITEITNKNIEYCKELRKIVHELRHLEGVKGNFIVSESDYIAIGIQKEGHPIPQLIHSNALAMIEQQQYSFETLWNKAIHAELKIREFEEGTLVETTEVIDGIENVINKLNEGFSKIKEHFDNCIDHTCPSAYVSTKQVWDRCLELKDRGVNLRFITEVTKENVSYCKEMMKVAELRHLDGIKGNFGIADGKDYRATANMQEGQPPTQAIRSTVKAFVEQQQHFFETLWGKAIPAKQRFKEIEQGAKREFVETIRDPAEIQKLGFDLIKKAEEEILILFSTTSAFRRQVKVGALQLIEEAALQPGMKVRILVPVDNNNKAIIISMETKGQLKELGIDIRQFKKAEQLYPHQNKLTMLIVDQSVCLTVELEEDTQEISEEAIGLGTYSNSESTVFAYTSIFENLWMHTEGRMRYDSKTTATHKHRNKNNIKTPRRSNSLR